MNATLEQEYLCPHCSHINAIELDTHREMYTTCDKCGSHLEVVPADGIGEKINLIVSLASSDIALR
ncbi:MAG: hypothetical protein CL587_15255 [Alteromonadaceae bacterium]|nr:hypothetical protein [Alteromonadaceae bacterium]